MLMIVTEVFQIARDIFGHNLVNIGVGGSLVNDIDTVVVLGKIDTEQIKKFIKVATKKTGQEVSVRPVTQMMLDTRYIDGKVATMIYKGMDWLFDEYHMSFEELQEIHKPYMAQNTSEILRAVSSGKLSKDKAINLLVQLLNICQ